MANLSYTVGNWTVASSEVDTISTAKTLSIPDLDFAHDFSVASQGATRTELLNTSGTALEPVERLVYTLSTVDNIFHGLEVPDLGKLIPKKGKAVIGASTYFLTATNAVSGETWTVPLRFQTKVEAITHNVMTSDALLWGLLRHFSQLFDTGVTTASLLLSAFRGDLDPTK